jgi:hypothetical protein
MGKPIQSILYFRIGARENPSFRQLIFIVERGFTIPAAFTELAGNASADPVNLHDVHLAAAGADALQLRFAETLDLRPFVKPLVGIL